MIYSLKSMKQGLTLVEVLLVIVCVVILFVLVNLRTTEGNIRGWVSRVKADQRSLATALEAYFVDNNSYPAWVCGGNGVCSIDWISSPGLGSANGFAGKKAGAAKIHTFRVWTANPSTDPNNQFFMLTTPISYVTSFFTDPFASTKGPRYGYSPSISYGYYAQKTGWIVISFGPDKDEKGKFAGDLDPYVEAALLPPWQSRYGNAVYDYHLAQPTLLLLTMDGKSATGLNYGGGSFTFDPTNGTLSQGDIWRCKQ
ncbi:MAG: hypothetical protein NTX50_04195 [Candidatus Sumerlaeota bacterium]|nr:hypothetical protein [Candidatus Sumerlaeota bacterium]